MQTYYVKVIVVSIHEKYLLNGDFFLKIFLLETCDGVFNSNN